MKSLKQGVWSQNLKINVLYYLLLVSIHILSLNVQSMVQHP